MEMINYGCLLVQDFSVFVFFLFLLFSLKNFKFLPKLCGKVARSSVHRPPWGRSTCEKQGSRKWIGRVTQRQIQTTRLFQTTHWVSGRVVLGARPTSCYLLNMKRSVTWNSFWLSFWFLYGVSLLKKLCWFLYLACNIIISQRNNLLIKDNLSLNRDANLLQNYRNPQFFAPKYRLLRFVYIRGDNFRPYIRAYSWYLSFCLGPSSMLFINAIFWDYQVLHSSSLPDML